MANLSDAGVDIVVEGVSKELINYINVTNETPTDYALVYDGFDTHENANGDFVISGNSSGRWAYSNNLEGYFKPDHVKSWLGVDNEYTWVTDEEKKKAYQSQSAKQYTAYLELIEALKKTNGSIRISYTDCDPAMDWMGEGGFDITVENGEVEFAGVFNEENLNIAKYADMQGESEYWALEVLHGEEVAEAFDKYLNACKTLGKESSDVDDWYENIYEMED